MKLLVTFLLISLTSILSDASANSIAVTDPIMESNCFFSSENNSIDAAAQLKIGNNALDMSSSIDERWRMAANYTLLFFSVTLNVYLILQVLKYRREKSLRTKSEF